MPIPDEDILDNQKRTMGSYLNEMLKSNPGSRFDVATAFFEVGAYSILRDNLGSVKHFRLLLGKSPDLRIDKTLGEELEKILRDGVKEEVESFDLTRENETAVQQLIKFLKQEKVEVRLHDQSFLHGKAYIFDNLVVIGSSNFTAAGLMHNGELNAVQLKGQSKYVREEWFEKFWGQSRNFKNELIQLLENSRFGTTEYTPYQVFIKALYELQRKDIEEEEKREKDTDSRVDLTDFQDDAITRIKTRLEKYGSVLIADSVGLGKTKIAAKIVEEVGYFKRKKFLVVCPAQLREMWRTELKELGVSEPILSLEDLGTQEFVEKAKYVTKDKLNEIELVVVDESHNLRNPLSNRWENFFTLMQDHISNDGERPYILFLTATPINNSIWDLYYQIQLLTGLDNFAFASENIQDLFQFFKKVDKEGDPNLLNDLLNEISIRRTRDYIQKNYPDAFIKDSLGNEIKVTFPKRSLENINYKLDSTYQGLYRHIAGVISEKLTMAYYNLLDYRKDPSQIDVLSRGRMIALEGIFRTILLKRLESSVQAFRISISNHIEFLEKLKVSLKQGKLLTKELYRKYLDDLEGQDELEADSPELFARQLKMIQELEDFKADDYKMDELLGDISEDIKLLKEIKEKVGRIDPKQDAKLIKFKEKLLSLAEKGQVVVFTYYADTLDYVFREVTSDKGFKKLRIEKISGKVPGPERYKLMEKFRKKEIDVILSTDVLSEGQNLQTAQYCVNYDLHWNPTRMIQRAGRIDRIGSPFKEIYVYNFFPEDELEELLALVRILQEKIIKIDASVGLDQSILGEKIHPKVFGIIKRIKEKDETVIGELEEGMFGGGERFYQPLKEFMRKASREELDKIPFGIHSGLRKRKGNAIFYYYQYDKTYHYWLLFDPETMAMITDNKTRIMDYTNCKENETRIIPDFFDSVYECNKKAVEQIEDAYKKLEYQNTQQFSVSHLSKQKSAKFILELIRFLDAKIDEHMEEYPADKQAEEEWDSLKNALMNIPYSKKRLGQARRIWRILKQDKKWGYAIKKLKEFSSGKHGIILKDIEPFDKKKLRLVVVDLVS